MKMIRYLLLVGIALLMWNASAAKSVSELISKKPWKSGNIKISTAEDLAAFRDAVNNGEDFEGRSVKLSGDIDLSAYKPWKPIGVFGVGKYFKGTFDGQGHTISNLAAYPTAGGDAEGNRSLFGFLDGTIINLGLVNGKMRGAYFGTISSHGSAKTKIINCYSYADIESGHRAAGIADNADTGIVANCAYFGTISNSGTVGGISSYAAQVFRCVSAIQTVPNNFHGKSIQNRITEDVRVAIDFLNDSLAQSAKFAGIDASKLCKWIMRDGKVALVAK